MKRQTLAALIASVFALAACGEQAAKPAETPAATASAEAPAAASDSQAAAETPSSELPVVDAIMTHAPEVPPAIDRDHPAKVRVKMETVEKTMTMEDGVEYHYWTFNGDVPGQMIRVREGDTVEVEFSNNPSSTVPHNVDFHAATGQGGGAEASFTAPGHTSTFSFKALQAGLYIYHCAVAPVGMHIANGMYGLILVEPKEGLPKVDKEFYIVQGDFYTKGKKGAQGLQPFDMDKAIAEQPEYVVFNGHVGSIAGDNALKAKAGETVRMYVGNGGPNLVSSFHVIGEIFDKVYVEGGKLINENVQSTVIPAGGAAMIEFKVDIPGSYTIVDHSIFRAFNKGALGLLVAKGEENRKIYAKNEPTPYVSDLKISTTPKDDAIVNKTKEQQIADGKVIYAKTCVACHQAQGQGMEGAFPPLAKSDFLNADVDRAIDIVLHGKQGEVTVNGKKYNSVMTPQPLSVQEVADVLTYVYNTWDNSKKVVTPEMVQKIKK